MNTLSEQNSHLLLDAQRGDERAFEQMIQDNSGLIWSIVRRFFGRGVEPDDLYQLGCLGFFKAVQGFDSAYGTQFSTYAVPKIAGEIRRFLRDDGPIKVSRSIKDKALIVKRAREELLQMLGREPHLSELSEKCELTPEEIAGIEMATELPESLQRETGEDGVTLEGLIGVAGLEDEVVNQVALRDAIDALPERERMVVLLRYYKGLTQEKAAVVLKVSQVQVSRIERKAMERLRTKIGR